MNSTKLKTVVVAVSGVLLLAQTARSQSIIDERFRERIDSIFSGYARPNAPGCAVGVFRSGKILHEQGYGLADVANVVPITPSTTFNIASTSKPFTALAVLLLVKDGKVGLDDDVRRYLPEVPDFGHTITVRMLLNHTSGLREFHNLFYLAGWRNSDVQTIDDVLSMLKRQRGLNHIPGAEFAYNSSGYTLLALIVERVSRMSFRQFIVDRIFKPLGMTHSDVQERLSQVIPHRATGYWGHDPAELRTAAPVNSFAGPNNVVTSVEDLARWDANFYKLRVGTKEIFDQMTTASKLNDGSEFGYGLGWTIGSHHGLKMISHAGSDYGYKAEFVRFPSEELTVTVLCNAFDIAPTPLALQVADLYLPKEEPATPQVSSLPNNSGDEAREFAGLYWNDAGMQSFRFFYEQGKLLLDGGGEGRFALRPLGNNSYRLMEAPRRYVFTFARDRTGIALQVDHEGSPLAQFRRVAERTPDVTALRAFEGDYYSPELDVTWKFVVRNGKLVLERKWTEPIEMQSVFGSVFLSPEGFALQFQRESGSKKMSVEISTERAKRVRFVRVTH